MVSRTFLGWRGKELTARGETANAPTWKKKTVIKVTHDLRDYLASMRKHLLLSEIQRVSLVIGAEALKRRRGRGSDCLGKEEKSSMENPTPYYKWGGGCESCFSCLG